MGTQYLFPGLRVRMLPALCLLSVVPALLPQSQAEDETVYALNPGMDYKGAWRLPDTGQTASYTATFGEYHDSQPQAAQMNYRVLNPVGISSVTVASSYWSSSTYLPSTGSAWVAVFGTGILGNAAKTNSVYARCVRGGVR